MDGFAIVIYNKVVSRLNQKDLLPSAVMKQ